MLQDSANGTTPSPSPLRGSSPSPRGGEEDYGGPSPSSERQPLDADEPVRHRDEAFELRREGVDPFAVIEVDDGIVLRQLLGEDVILLQPLGLVVAGARRLDRSLGRRVAKLAVVLRAVTGEEEVDIAVGIGAPA